MIDRPFRDGLPVKLIATPRAEFMTCDEKETVGEVRARNTQAFDHIPVVDDTDGIVGCLSPVASIDDSQLISDCMEPLREHATVGEECDIVSFIEGLHKQPYWFTVGRDGISGLVTWSDIQKLPARIALFALVTQLELLMLERIEEFHPDETWMALLSKSRLERTRSKIKMAKERDSLIAPLHYTDFCDKRDILRKRYGGKSFVSSMRKIEDLRNSLAHASEYAAGKHLAQDVSKIVSKTSEVIEMIAADVVSQS